MTTSRTPPGHRVCDIFDKNTCLIFLDAGKTHTSLHLQTIVNYPEDMSPVFRVFFAISTTSNIMKSARNSMSIAISHL